MMHGKKERPWMFRTYAGHSSAERSNELYRANLAKGQSGLSVAFDLPTQTGYDPDHALAKGEVGRVGVPLSHLGDMRALFAELPLEQMNTSMTINATAPWLLALYVALADERGVDRAELKGTTQNDLIKEYLSRGTYAYPPDASLRLSCQLATWTLSNMPKWNPMNVCSYHLQEAGAEPVQEVAFAMATAVEILDRVKHSGEVSLEGFPAFAGRLSFFVNAGMRFVTEMCKMRAFAELWDEVCLHRYGVQEPKMRRFRYGVQVNSLGLTEQQPENNVARILIEMLAVTLSKKARARAVQLPAWNEALGLPRAVDQQWSLRLQQILAYETDLLEFDDLFDGNKEVDAKTAAILRAAREEMERILHMGGAAAAVESGYMKSQLVEANAQRLALIESGEQVVVGVNRWADGDSLLVGETGAAATQGVDAQEAEMAVQRLVAWKDQRDAAVVEASLEQLRQVLAEGANIMPASIDCAKAGVTTGEWAEVLRQRFGAYRAPTGVSNAARNEPYYDDGLRSRVEKASEQLGRPPRVLIGKPGLDGHSNGAEQIAVRARDAGMHVVFDGIRLTPAQIVAAAAREGVDVIGLSVLSGAHLQQVEDVLAQMQTQGLQKTPLVLGGIVSEEDQARLLELGVSAVYTPKDFRLEDVLSGVVEVLLAAK
ncbi:methylmalonyl-CoA mutase family protein [Polycladidibacter hongkongensis]|uniref:methylmalonyl-CoA mutase family protein n=1 Tax=Polycladidibacter hongkongensis TaxID=1647556 RepID=UPI00082E1BC1|nr:methylmalonyl-CoA mutase family protein [Pseudovibrio hongkongensis]